MFMKFAGCMATAAIAACLFGPSVYAQVNDSNHGGKTMAASGDIAGKSMDGVLSIYEKDIVGAAEAMPADKFDFAPSQADFKAKVDYSTPKPVMTFAQEVRHLAQANYNFYSVGGMKPDRDVKAISKLTGRDEIIQALKDSFAFAHKACSSMTATSGFEEVELFGSKSTRAASYAFGLAHMGDHYGQMVEYLRMNAIVPPASRK